MTAEDRGGDGSDGRERGAEAEAGESHAFPGQLIRRMRRGGFSVGIVRANVAATQVIAQDRNDIRRRGAGVCLFLCGGRYPRHRPARGYSRPRLDTLAMISAAITLCRKLGIVDIPADTEKPIEDALYLELTL